MNLVVFEKYLQKENKKMKCILSIIGTYFNSESQTVTKSRRSHCMIFKEFTMVLKISIMSIIIVPMMKFTDLSHLLKWENIHYRQLLSIFVPTVHAMIFVARKDFVTSREFTSNLKIISYSQPQNTDGISIQKRYISLRPLLLFMFLFLIALYVFQESYSIFKKLTCCINNATK